MHAHDARMHTMQYAHNARMHTMQYIGATSTAPGKYHIPTVSTSYREHVPILFSRIMEFSIHSIHIKKGREYISYEGIFNTNI